MDFLENLTPEMLVLSVPLQGVVVWILVEYLVKRNLSSVAEERRGIIVNLSSAVVGILLSLAVTFIAVGLGAKEATWAIIQGLLAGGVATLLHETIGNAVLAYNFFKVKKEEDAP